MSGTNVNLAQVNANISDAAATNKFHRHWDIRGFLILILIISW